MPDIALPAASDGVAKSLEPMLPRKWGPPPTPPLAARKIQRWYRSRKRRMRFLEVLRRAVERRRRLEQRARIARRIEVNAQESLEMRQHLAQPRGARLVERWMELREVRAAEKVQSLWRALRRKREMALQAGQQERQTAAIRLQAFFRRRRMREHESVLREQVLGHPCWSPLDAPRLHQLEEDLAQRRQRHQDEYRRRTEQEREQFREESRQKGTALYADFCETATEAHEDIYGLLVEQARIRHMIKACEGRGWSRPLPPGTCNPSFMAVAREKHELRKAATERVVEVGGLPPPPLAGIDQVTVESLAEEREADALLQGLEHALGYDFRLAHEKVPVLR